MGESETQLLAKVEQRVGTESFNRTILKLCSCAEITELNLKRNEIDEIVLPLSQIGIIRVRSQYFYERPDPNKTRYDVFSLSSRGEEFVDSRLKTMNLSGIANLFVDKYPPKFLAFMIHFLFESPYGYDPASECNEYEKLFEKDEIACLKEEFVTDLEKFSCGFWIKHHTSKRISNEPSILVLLPAFRDQIKKLVPKETVETEIDEVRLACLAESRLLRPSTKEEWYQDFSRIVDNMGVQDMWRDWSNELQAAEILVNHVTLNPVGLREFLAKKIKAVQKLLSSKTPGEMAFDDLFKTLESKGTQMDESERSDIAPTCRTRKDFSIFISAMYRMLHDKRRTKDETIDAIRCFFHHDKQDSEQEWYKRKFEEYCRTNMISVPPRNNEWEILRTKTMRKAVESVVRNSSHPAN